MHTTPDLLHIQDPLHSHSCKHGRRKRRAELTTRYQNQQRCASQRSSSTSRPFVLGWVTINITSWYVISRQGQLSLLPTGWVVDKTVWMITYLSALEMSILYRSAIEIYGLLTLLPSQLNDLAERQNTGFGVFPWENFGNSVHLLQPNASGPLVRGPTSTLLWHLAGTCPLLPCTMGETMYRTDHHSFTLRRLHAVTFLAIGGGDAWCEYRPAVEWHRSTVSCQFAVARAQTASVDCEWRSWSFRTERLVRHDIRRWSPACRSDLNRVWSWATSPRISSCI